MDIYKSPVITSKSKKQFCVYMYVRVFVQFLAINNLLDLIWLNVIGCNQGLLGSAFCPLRKLVYAIKLCSLVASVNLAWENRCVLQSLTRKMSEIWAKKFSIWWHKTTEIHICTVWAVLNKEKCNWVRNDYRQ